jgi:hypothetical protein
MKIAMRVLVLTLVFAGTGVLGINSFAGPGVPVPPATLSHSFAGPGVPVPPATLSHSFAGPGVPVPPATLSTIG